MNTPSPSSPQDTEQKIMEIFKLFEDTFSSKDTKKIKEAREKLGKIFTNIKISLDILFQAITIKEIQGKQISLDLHKSVAIYLKNLFFMQKSLSGNDLYNCLLKIFDLIFNQSRENVHLIHPTILSIFQTIVYALLSNQSLLEEGNKEYINKLFNILLSSLQNVKKENFLSVAKSAILLSTSLLTSKSTNMENIEKLYNDYYIPIINIIFSNVGNYIIPKDNMYNMEYISILKFLLDGFYTCLLKTKYFLDNEKRKELSMKLFKEYGTYCFELIQLTPNFDEINSKF